MKQSEGPFSWPDGNVPLAFRQGMIYIKDLFGSLAGLYEDSLFIGDTFEFLNLKENIIAAEPVVITPDL